MSRKSNQITHILSHLQSGRSITSMEAFELYGCTRLSDKIFRLRKQGYNIVTISRETIDRYGDRCVYGEYRLRDDAKVIEEANYTKSISLDPCDWCKSGYGKNFCDVGACIEYSRFESIPHTPTEVTDIVAEFHERYL